MEWVIFSGIMKEEGCFVYVECKAVDEKLE